jgi:N6-adenosine-specific RNA methylase IME4
MHIECVILVHRERDDVRRSDEWHLLELVAETRTQVEEYEQQYADGLITRGEKQVGCGMAMIDPAECERLGLIAFDGLVN